MKVLMFYRPNSEFARRAEEFVREFERRTAKIIDKVNIDSPEGISKAKLYGVMDHPTFVAVSDDGQFLKAWTGKPLPLINEVSAYVDSN
jgi:hypothetical protein